MWVSLILNLFFLCSFPFGRNNSTGELLLDWTQRHLMIKEKARETQAWFLEKQTQLACNEINLLEYTQPSISTLTCENRFPSLPIMNSLRFLQVHGLWIKHNPLTRVKREPFFLYLKGLVLKLRVTDERAYTDSGILWVAGGGGIWRNVSCPIHSRGKKVPESGLYYGVQ